MTLLEKLKEKWQDKNSPFLIYGDSELRFSDIENQHPLDLSQVKQGDVVALIGDFTPSSILTLLRLIDLGTIVVPLTQETRQQHAYFFESALVDLIIEGSSITRRSHTQTSHLIEQLRLERHAGLVLFSTGTTGRPKAILHDFSLFLRRFDTPRPTLRTMNFLLFDHIGGINTLLHTLFNGGVVIAPRSRDVQTIIEDCRRHSVEVLPTTPTFLRMMLLSGLIPDRIPDCLKIITYGTERMDQPTLDELCRLLPNVDFRQTFGMSELGIVRVKSESRNSLFMKIGGEGVETKTLDSVLYIRSPTRMMGYLNADSPFDEEGWYNTRDIVDSKDSFVKVVGRTTEVINVGGLKFMASEVERVALEFHDVLLAKAYGKNNPITGQHVELEVQPKSHVELNEIEFKRFLQTRLEPHMMPKRIRIQDIKVGHRFKRS